jgi:hypothetical protein
MFIINKKTLIFNTQEIYFSDNFLKFENFLYTLKIIFNQNMNQIFIYSKTRHEDYK